MSDGQNPEMESAVKRRVTLVDMLVYAPWVLSLLLLVGFGCWLVIRHQQSQAGPPQVPQTVRQATTPVTVTTQPAQPAAQAATPPTADLPVICIDPGHPSETAAGDVKQNGLREVEIVYDVAMKLKGELEGEEALQQPIARVVMTRHFRSYNRAHPQLVTNRQRAEIANQAHAVLFLRLHCDTGKGSGFAVYYPDKAATKDGRTGPAPAMRRESARAAKAVHRGLADVLSGTLRDNGVKGESATFVGGKQGALTGSIFSDVPAVTVEMVYLSNPQDARFIGSSEGRQALAQALALGISYYLTPDKPAP